MAYKPKYKKRRYKKKSYNKYVGYANTAIKALAIAKSVAELVNVEYKENVKAASGLSVDNLGTVVNLSLLAQGLNYTNRVGMSIKLTSLFGRIHMLKNASATFQSIRMVIFIDRQSNGITPLVGEVLDTVSYLSPLSSLYGKRFKVICDEMISLGNGSSTNEVIKCYRKLRHHMEFQGTSANAASISSGSIYMLLISNDGTNPPSVDYNWKLRFIDN